MRLLEHHLEKLHRRFNRIRPLERQQYERQMLGGGRGVIYEDEAVALGAIMTEACRLFDELEALEGKMTTEAKQVFDDAMKRINLQRRTEQRRRW